MFIFVFVRLYNNVNAAEVVAFPVRRIGSQHTVSNFFSLLDVVISNNLDTKLFGYIKHYV